jgi:ribulose-bisphosphate carboxylase large chain
VKPTFRDGHLEVFDSFPSYFALRMQGSPKEGALVAVYELSSYSGPEAERVRELFLEETVELPAAAVPRELQAKLGEILWIRNRGSGRVEAAIAYHREAFGREVPQALNVLFGNISLWRNVRLVRVQPERSLRDIFPGARFGQKGLRKKTRVYGRPLLCAALKPMGLAVEELARLTYRLARAGIDMIKDDHGLGDQDSAPFFARVRECSAAVRAARETTGKNTLYFAGITGPLHLLRDRALYARDAGADGLLLCPGVCGWDALRFLATDPELGLPILVHPSFLGSQLARGRSGLSAGALFGQLPRLLGADGTIFPHWRSRFPFSRKMCKEIVGAASEPLRPWKPIFPVPAGGIQLDELPEVLRFYGREAVILLGGSILHHPAGPEGACRKILAALQERFAEAAG